MQELHSRAAALIERPLWEGPFLGYEEYQSIPPEEAERIIKGDIIPIINGRAEFGPRALGNRTLLCAPIDSTIDRLNKIKGRNEDSWRPLRSCIR